MDTLTTEQTNQIVYSLEECAEQIERLTSILEAARQIMVTDEMKGSASRICNHANAIAGKARLNVRNYRMRGVA